MAIEKTTKYDIEDICKEFEINLDEFIALVNNKIGTYRNQITPGCSKTIIEVIEEYIDHIKYLSSLNKRSEETVRGYLYFYNNFITFLKSSEKENLKIDALDETLLLEFIRTKTELKNTVFAEGTIRKHSSFLRSVLGFAFHKQYTIHDYRSRFELKTQKLLPKYIPLHEIEMVLKSSLDMTNGYRNYALLTLLLGTGCRLSELVNIRISDFNLESNILFIRKGKGNKQRYIPIFPEVKKVIIDYLEITGIKQWDNNLEGYLFSKEFGEKRSSPLTSRGIEKMVERLSKKHKNIQFTPHSFRHTFAVYCLKAGMPLHILTLLLGHNDPKTTMIYTQLFPNDLREEVLRRFPFPFEQLISKLINSEGQEQ
ncbi:tyrosine-type recombinase/integrase [Brevibacillus centrosporus]|uniref:Integrase/recombinase XerD n=1 Tax=Brevibacillus centrosporus TaxID=54910 RepID=A0A1I4E315_9BACL|nr:tyrosine-type recombinase/integrase [Brevibacillus centrosporus]SFK99653.1 integrase/recombinase XerD [Brevibacillus centrosporus]